MNIDSLMKKIDLEIGEAREEIPIIWDQNPLKERRYFFQRLYLEFRGAKKEIQDFVNSGGDSVKLAEKSFNDLPKILQAYIKMAFNAGSEEFSCQNIRGSLNRLGIPVDF